MLAMGGVHAGRRLRRRQCAFAAMRPALTRRHVYIDTMGLNPVTMRAAIDMLGADHVLMGTDWPIVEEKSVPSGCRRRSSIARSMPPSSR